MKRRTILKAPVLALVPTIALAGEKRCPNGCWPDGGCNECYQISTDKSIAILMETGTVTLSCQEHERRKTQPSMCDIAGPHERFMLYKMTQPLTRKIIRKRLNHIKGCEFIRLKSPMGANMFVPRACIREIPPVEYDKAFGTGIICISDKGYEEVGYTDCKEITRPRDHMKNYRLNS